MAVDKLYGRIISTLKSISDTDLTVNSEFKLEDASNMDIPSEGYLTIGNADDLAPSDIGEPPDYEKVKYTSFTRNGDGTTTFSGLNRAQGNTEATSWSSGVDVGLAFAPETLTRVLSNLYSTEKAQDDVGSIMSGTGLVTVNYDDSTPKIEISVTESDISHDNITGVSTDDHHVAHEHPGDKSATGDITDDKANTIYDYSAEEIDIGVIPLSDISHDSISGVSANDHHQSHEHPGDRQATSDIEDDQGNTIWDYVNQYIPDSVIEQSNLDADTLDSVQLADIDWTDVAMAQTDVGSGDVGLGNVLNKAQLAKDGSENLTGDLSDDQGNTIYDYSAQEIALAVIQNVLSHSDLSDAPTDAHHTDPTAGTGITDEGTNQFGLDVVLSGQVTLSSGVATIDTTLSATDATFMLALGIDDPNADCEVAGRVFWDDSAGTYKIKILEQNTSVGNPTVNYDVVRVR